MAMVNNQMVSIPAPCFALLGDVTSHVASSMWPKPLPLRTGEAARRVPGGVLKWGNGVTRTLW